MPNPATDPGDFAGMDVIASGGYGNGGSGFSPSGSVVITGNADDGLPDWAKADPDLPDTALAFSSSGDKAVDAWMARRDAWCTRPI